MEHLTHRKIRQACLRAAEVPTRGLAALPYLASVVVLVAFLGRSLTLPAVVLCAFVHVASRRELRLRDIGYRHSQRFAEQLAEALIPPPMAQPLRPVCPGDRTAFILRACRRAAAREGQSLGRGLFALATISSTAPLFGLLGTAIGIIHSFRGSTGEKSAIMAAILSLISESLISSAFALALAVFAYFLHQSLTAKQQALARQMDTLSLSLANALRLEL